MRVLMVLGVVFIATCCCCFIPVWGYSLIPEDGFNFEWSFDNDRDDNRGDIEVDPFPQVITREAEPLPEMPQGTPTAEDVNGALETLITLEEAIVPNSDPVELAQRLGGVEEVVPFIPTPPEYAVGDTQTFWASNVDTNENFLVDAVLRYKTDHMYFWIEQGVEYSERALANLAETFENEIYPRNREFFGSEWTPGIDNDPHLNILLARNLGVTLAGYFSSADAVPPSVHPYSNAREMFLLNADNISLDEEFTYGVLAHEFQHMIHWYRDRNEESWLNEGFSELASFLNGYDPGGLDYYFMRNPDLQLNDWPDDSNATTAHYGASFLFVTYFLDRFGEEATKAVVAHPDNGLDSIDAVLADLGEVDPLTGQPITAEDLILDWTLANFIQDPAVGDGRYAYGIYPDAPQASVSEYFSDCSGAWETGSVRQFGADYIHLSCDGPVTLRFEGTHEIGVLPEDPYSGKYAVWSNKGDESNMTLTRTFNLTPITDPVEMTFRMWFDLETDYDYLYLTASTDGGKTWEIIKTPSCTYDNPSGNSYGCGYNGETGGWVEETVDLTAYTGREVMVRFEYVTDAAVNGEGFLLDDISIPAIGYSTDFETGLDGWEAEGWVRIQNRLPQRYSLALIIEKDGQTSVQYLELDENNRLELPLAFGSDLDEAVLVINGATRFTRQAAPYRISLDPGP